MANRLSWDKQTQHRNKVIRQGVSNGEVKQFRKEGKALAARVAKGMKSNGLPCRVLSPEEKAEYARKLGFSVKGDEALGDPAKQSGD